MSRTRRAFVLALLTAAALSPRELAAQPAPVGPETQVDTQHDYYVSTCPQIGIAPDRSFEIAWSAGFHWPTDVRVRHYNANGAPADRSEVGISPEIEPEDQDTPRNVLAVTPISNGFRVLYGFFHNYDLQFFRRRIDPAGVPAPGAPRPLGAPGTQWIFPGPGDSLFAGKYNAALSRLSMQKVDPLGQPAGPLYVLNTRPIVLTSSGDLGLSPVIRPLSDGGWVAAFAGTSLAAPGSPARQVIRARRFNAAGAPLGPDFDVNSTPGGTPGNPPVLAEVGLLVAAGSGGRFAVAWTAGSAIRLRLFDSAARPAGPETLVARDRDLEFLDSMAFDNAGRLLLLWTSNSGDNPTSFQDDLRAQLIRPNGTLVGTPFRLRSAASEDFPAPLCGSVAWAGDSWMITWLALFDEDDDAIFVRRFR
jgi:hypothetical protein